MEPRTTCVLNVAAKLFFSCWHQLRTFHPLVIEICTNELLGVRIAMQLIVGAYRKRPPPPGKRRRWSWKCNTASLRRGQIIAMKLLSLSLSLSLFPPPSPLSRSLEESLARTQVSSVAPGTRVLRCTGYSIILPRCQPCRNCSSHHVHRWRVHHFS